MAIEERQPRRDSMSTKEAVLIRVTLTTMTHYDQKQAGEGRVYLAYTANHCSSLKEVTTGT